jgi:hypothetical protein
MVEDNVVEEIYAVLVEQFGVGEIFLPKFRKRTVDILWKDFIKKALEGSSSTELAPYCGYCDASALHKGLAKKYPAILKDKANVKWFTYFSTIVGKKRCSSCHSILYYKYFNNNSSYTDGLNPYCSGCQKKLSKEYQDKTGYNRKYRDLNQEAIKIQNKKWREDNKEKIKIYRELNREHKARYNRDYHFRNREVLLERKREYSKKHINEESARSAKRRAVKLQAMPKWADREKIKQIYATRPEGYHVDHIIPLQHPLVCGLHCEFNLQHLPAAENISKHNKFDLDKQA